VGDEMVSGEYLNTCPGDDDEVCWCFQVSVVRDKKSLVLYMLLNPVKSVELDFMPEYGDIISHQWSVQLFW